MYIHTVKTLLEECKTSNSDIDRSYKFAVFYDDNDVELMTNLLSEEAISI